MLASIIIAKEKIQRTTNESSLVNIHVFTFLFLFLFLFLVGPIRSIGKRQTLLRRRGDPTSTNADYYGANPNRIPQQQLENGAGNQQPQNQFYRTAAGQTAGNQYPGYRPGPFQATGQGVNTKPWFNNNMIPSSPTGPNQLPTNNVPNTNQNNNFPPNGFYRGYQQQQQQNQQLQYNTPISNAVHITQAQGGPQTRTTSGNTGQNIWAQAPTGKTEPSGTQAQTSTRGQSTLTQTSPTGKTEKSTPTQTLVKGQTSKTSATYKTATTSTREQSTLTQTSPSGKPGKSTATQTLVKGQASKPSTTSTDKTATTSHKGTTNKQLQSTRKHPLVEKFGPQEDNNSESDDGTDYPKSSDFSSTDESDSKEEDDYPKSSDFSSEAGTNTNNGVYESRDSYSAELHPSVSWSTYESFNVKFFDKFLYDSYTSDSDSEYDEVSWLESALASYDDKDSFFESDEDYQQWVKENEKQYKQKQMEEYDEEIDVNGKFSAAPAKITFLKSNKVCKFSYVHYLRVHCKK